MLKISKAVVTIYETYNLIEAQRIEAELTAQNIFVFVTNRNIASNLPHYNIPLEVKVRENDKMRALKIINFSFSFGLERGQSFSPKSFSRWMKGVAWFLLVFTF